MPKKLMFRPTNIYEKMLKNIETEKLNEIKKCKKKHKTIKKNKKNKKIEKEEIILDEDFKQDI